MKITNQEALDFFKSVNQSVGKTVCLRDKCAAASKALVLQHSIKGDLDFTRHFERLIQAKKSFRGRENQNVDEWRCKIFYEETVATKRTGRPSVTLSDEPSTKTARSILKEQVDTIEKFAKIQKISKEEALEMLVEECKRQWKTPAPDNSTTIPDLDATALMYNVNLSIPHYQMLRTILLPHHINLPIRNNIDQIKKTLHPTIKCEEIKSSVSIKDLVLETGIALLEITDHKIDNGACYEVIGKFGVDGSGSHKVRHQIANKVSSEAENPHLDPTKSSNMLLSCYCPLEVKKGDTTIWKKPVPNSTCYTRPVFLMQATEERSILSIELKEPLEFIKGVSFSNATTETGEEFELKFKTECSMVDGKMVSLLQGDSGAFCHMCTTTRAEGNNIINILEGFHINKDYESCCIAWQKVEQGEISYSSSERQGQCHPSIVESDLHFFSILHFKLRSLDFVQKILYHIVSGQKVWSDSGNYVSKFLSAAKKHCIEQLRQTTGMLIDSPTTSGGNTNSGPLADKFFSVQNRLPILDLINNSTDRENFGILLSQFNVMLQITQSLSDRKVIVEKVRQLGLELMAHLKNNFLDESGKPWVMIIPSVHQTCAHAWEMFLLNDGSSIAKWSENPIESWNKHVRAFRSGPASRARQCSVKANIKDIFRRMLIQSHPKIASKRPQVKCSVCGNNGHTARSSVHKRDYDVKTEEEMVVNSVYM